MKNNKELEISQLALNRLYQELLSKNLLTREIKEVFHKHYNIYTRAKEKP